MFVFEMRDGNGAMIAGHSRLLLYLELMDPELSNLDPEIGWNWLSLDQELNPSTVDEVTGEVEVDIALRPSDQELKVELLTDAGVWTITGLADDPASGLTVTSPVVVESPQAGAVTWLPMTEPPQAAFVEEDPVPGVRSTWASVIAFEDGDSDGRLDPNEPVIATGDAELVFIQALTGFAGPALSALALPPGWSVAEPTQGMAPNVRLWSEGVALNAAP
jgi:hypothetical protein